MTPGSQVSQLVTFRHVVTFLPTVNAIFHAIVWCSIEVLAVRLVSAILVGLPVLEMTLFRRVINFPAVVTLVLEEMVVHIIMVGIVVTLVAPVPVRVVPILSTTPHVASLSMVIRGNCNLAKDEVLKSAYSSMFVFLPQRLDMRMRMDFALNSVRWYATTDGFNVAFIGDLGGQHAPKRDGEIEWTLFNTISSLSNDLKGSSRPSGDEYLTVY